MYKAYLEHMLFPSYLLITLWYVLRSVKFFRQYNYLNSDYLQSVSVPWELLKALAFLKTIFSQDLESPWKSVRVTYSTWKSLKIEIV